MPETEFVAGRRKVMAPIAAAVVGQDPFDRDAVARIEAPGSMQEAGRRGRRLVRQFLGIRETAEVVDRHVDAVPTDPAMTILLATPSVNPMPATCTDPAEHLGIEVDELAWALALVSDDWFAGLQAIESVQAGPSKERIHGRSRESRLPTENVRSDSELSATGTQLLDKFTRVRSRLATDDAATIE